MKSRLALTAAFGIGMALLAAGCGTTTTTTSTGTAIAKPVKNGNIVYALPPDTSVNWFIPLVNSGYDSLYNFQLIDQMYMPLLYINKSYGIDYANSIAKNVTWNKQGTIYHVFLNSKWKWSNGNPVTTKDILFTWNLIKATSSSKAPPPWPYVGSGSGDIPTGVQSVVANGKYEFTVTLKKPANQQWFEYDGLNQFTPLPESAWNRYPTNITKEIKWLGAKATNDKIDSVVDGPYKIQSATPNQSWVLVPNKKFSGHKALDRITFAYEGSNAAEFAALKTGTVQVGYIDLSQYGARKQLTNDTITPGYPFDYNDIELNLNKNAQGGLGPVFSQLYVRQALEMAIPQSATNTSIFHGFGPPQYGPIPTVPATQYLAPQLKKPIYPFNLTRAKNLLLSHGWKMKNGVMTKGSAKLQFTLLYTGGTQSTTDQMVLIQTDWKKIGVEVTLKSEQFSSLIGTIDTLSKSPQWDAAGGQGIIYAGSYPSGGALFGTGGGLNQFGWNNKEENKLIAATHAPSASKAALIKTFFNYEVYTSKELPNLWVNNVASINAIAKNVHGVTSSTLNNVTGLPLMGYWWVSK